MIMAVTVSRIYFRFAGKSPSATKFLKIADGLLVDEQTGNRSRAKPLSVLA